MSKIYKTAQAQTAQAALTAAPQAAPQGPPDPPQTQDRNEASQHSTAIPYPDPEPMAGFVFGGWLLPTGSFMPPNQPIPVESGGFDPMTK